MNKTIYSINGIRRSGNHAVANWIIAHFETSCYINDANGHLRLKSNELPAHKNYSKIADLDTNPIITVIGFENKLHNNRNTVELYKNYLQIKIDAIHIFLIRNCLNLIASHIQAWPNGTYHEQIPDHWKQYIDTYNINQNNNYLLIYDSWLDKPNRDIIAGDLGFTNFDYGFEQIPKYGGGSSFRDKIVNTDNLKNRWKSMVNNNRFCTIVNSFPYWDDYIKLFGEDEAYYYFNS